VRLGGRAERTWLSVDIDVVDPGSAPGTGAPEPGGLTPRELLRAVRRIGREVELCGLEVVEVSPPYDHADVTALLAHRVVLETVSGLALRRRGREPAPERPRPM
jgi:arginase family enzyme